MEDIKDSIFLLHARPDLTHELRQVPHAAYEQQVANQMRIHGEGLVALQRGRFNATQALGPGTVLNIPCPA